MPSTIVLGPSKDNTLYQSTTGDISNGAGSYFIAGETGGGSIRRGVIAFDIAGNIPAGATINSAVLSLHMSQAAAGTAATVQLTRLSADWGEGTSNADGNPGQGTTATTGDATWVYRFYSSSSWTNAGGDFATTVSAFTSVGSSGTYTWGSTTRMVSDVQGWLDNSANNFGWAVLGDESQSQTAKRFDSRENSTSANRPTLTINYTSSTSSASTLALSGFASPQIAGAVGTETVTAKDSSGNTATDYRGTVHFTSSDSQAALPANYTFTAADAGVHNFSVTLKTAGTQSITATDTGAGSINGSQSGITITPASPDHLNVGTPGNGIAGTPFDLSVTAQDVYNNTATGYTGTVTFASSDTGATLPSNYTFTASDNGVHTFSSGATLILAGSQTITASDTTTTSIAGTSTVSVSAAALDHFSMSSAGTVAAGMPFDLIVTALDHYGNTVTGYTGTVTFTTSDQDPQISLPADYTFSSGDNGTHTFSGGATLYSSGDQTITVTDTSDNTLFGILMVTL